MNKYAFLVINIFALFVIISSKNDLKYLDLEFERNLTLGDSFTPEEFYKHNFYNQIFVKMKVGSEKQEIPFYLYLRQYSFSIQSANSNDKEVKGIYNELKSGTYKLIESQSFNNKDYNADDLFKVDVSEDVFYINDISPTMLFYLSKENYAASHITEGGKIGLDFSRHDFKNDSLNFINYLKKKNLISTYYFSIIYDSKELNNDKWHLYIGALLHDINGKRYSNNSLSITSSTSFEWAFTFRHILFGDKIIDTQIESHLYPEFGFISGNEKFFDALNNSGLWSEYFNKNEKCHTYKFQISDFESYYIYRFNFQFTAYYCDKDVDVDKLIPKNITFRDFILGYDLVLNNKDIWIEKNGYKFLLILKYSGTENIWIFGAPFFKKFHMTFNPDLKQLGVYTYVDYNAEEDDNHGGNNLISVYIIIISVLLILSGVLAFFLIKIYVNHPRKKRANELLDDNFEYKINENAQNEIIRNEE